MKRFLITAVLSLFVGFSFLYAQKESIVLHYKFKEAVGNKVKDFGPHHADAVLKNGASVKNGKLVLESKDAYLDMTPKAGEIVSKLKNFTVFVRYKVAEEAKIAGNGHFLWCFSSLPANKEKEGPYQAYRINQQRCETSIGGWSQETAVMQGSVSEKGKWVNVIFRQSGNKGELFINGKLIATQQGFPILKNIFTSAPKYNWIGRAPFDGDKYLTLTKISDFRIYNICMSNDSMKKLLEKQNEKKKDKKKGGKK